MLNGKCRKVRKGEQGIALLVSLFMLLIISAVGLSLVLSAGTESSLAGNYRRATAAHYAAMAGLEEGRGRMLPKNPDYFNNTVPGFVPAPNTALAVGQVRYILNPAPGETVAPTDLTSITTYPDKEYQQEYGNPVSSALYQSIASKSSLSNGSIPGPAYKWVRIGPATEQSLNIDVNNDGVYDNTVSLFYDTAALPVPSLTLGVFTGAGQPAKAPNATSVPVFEITALAVIPGGGEKLLQYVVTPAVYSLDFPAALNLPGSSVAFNGANSNQWFADGVDGSGNPPAVPGCTPNQPTVPAVGVTSTGTINNVANVMSGIPGDRLTHYTGSTSTTDQTLTSPSVSNISLNSNLQTPAGLNQLTQQITQNADLVISGNATQANMPSQMSASNPMTVVVNGNFSMTGNYTGYGLLVVTGNFAYSGDSGWKGVVLVIGHGTTNFLGTGGGNNEFDGAMLVANIKDSSGNLLTALGTNNFNISGGGGNGIYYNSCWINAAQSPSTYKMLSYREIAYGD
jgi:hypothetical protein